MIRLESYSFHSGINSINLYTCMLLYKLTGTFARSFNLHKSVKVCALFFICRDEVSLRCAHVDHLMCSNPLHNMQSALRPISALQACSGALWEVCVAHYCVSAGTLKECQHTRTQGVQEGRVHQEVYRQYLIIGQIMLSSLQKFFRDVCIISRYCDFFVAGSSLLYMCKLSQN